MEVQTATCKTLRNTENGGYKLRNSPDVELQILDQSVLFTIKWKKGAKGSGFARQSVFAIRVWKPTGWNITDLLNQNPCCRFNAWSVVRKLRDRLRPNLVRQLCIKSDGVINYWPLGIILVDSSCAASLVRLVWSLVPTCEIRTSTKIISKARLFKRRLNPKFRLNRRNHAQVNFKPRVSSVAR